MNAKGSLIASVVVGATALIACGAAPTESTSSTSQAVSRCVAAPSSGFWQYGDTLPTTSGAVWFQEIEDATYVDSNGNPWVPFVAIDRASGAVVLEEWVPESWTLCFMALYRVCSLPATNTTGAQSGSNDGDGPRVPVGFYGPPICVSPGFAANAAGTLLCTVPSDSPPECNAAAPDGGLDLKVVNALLDAGSSEPAPAPPSIGGGANGSGEEPPPPSGPVLLQ